MKLGSMKKYVDLDPWSQKVIDRVGSGSGTHDLKTIRRRFLSRGFDPIGNMWGLREQGFEGPLYSGAIQLCAQFVFP
jgi:hypothetical protein